MALRSVTEVLPQSDLIGLPIGKVDSLLKVTGRAMYTGDLRLPGMLYGCIKRCPHPHARILKVGAEELHEMQGVKAVITANDFPPFSTEETPPFASQEVMYVNQAVAAVAAINQTTAEHATEVLQVDYEILPAVFDPELSMSQNTPVLIGPPASRDEASNIGKHVKVRIGDVEEAFKKADLIFENQYGTAAESHLQLERLTFLAQPDFDGGVTLWATTTGAHRLQSELSRFLGLDPYLVRVIVPLLGGWFGSKEETHLAAICAKLALKTQRPVKLELSREETMTASAIRHPSVIRIKDGVMKDGKIIAREIHAIYDGGVYCSVGNGILRNSILASASVYNVPNLRLDAYRVYTNRVPGSAKRAPIGTQMIWAIESQMDHIASKLALDPISMRLSNVLRDGMKNPIGEKMANISHDKCLIEVVKRIALEAKHATQGPWKTGKGVALAAKWGPGGPHQAMVKVRETGKVEVWADLIENGQGILTAVAQIVATEFGIPTEDVLLPGLLYGSGSISTPLAPGAYSSRQLVNMGKAVMLACEDAKTKIVNLASKKFAERPEQLDVKAGCVFVKSQPSNRIKISQLFVPAHIASGGRTFGFLLPEGELVGYGTVQKNTGELDPDTGRCIGDNVSPYYITVAQGAEVQVNTETGHVKVNRIVAAMDVGKAINPGLVRAQIIGSVAMGVSATLSEELIFSDGRATNATLADYKVLTTADMPLIEPVIVETHYEDGPYGAKGAGEASILPTAAAVGNAIHDAIGIWINTLPITPEKILDALHNQPF